MPSFAWLFSCEEGAGRPAELVGVDLRPEHVLQVLVLEHRRGGADVGPHELLLRVDLLGQRHAVGARVDAHDQVDVLLVQQALGLADRDLGLGLRVGDDRGDLVALDAALLVDHVDRDLGADRGGFRAAGGERAGEVVDHADLDLLVLGHGVLDQARRRQQARGRQRRRRAKPGPCRVDLPQHCHPSSPARCSSVCLPVAPSERDVHERVKPSPGWREARQVSASAR